MTRIAADAWSRLEASRPAGVSLTARLAVPEKTDRLLCAVDAELQRHLLVLLRTGEQDLHDAESRGLSVDTRELSIHGHESGRYLDLKCHDAAGHDVFDLIGSELAEALSRPGNPPAESVHRVLAKWRRFWGQLPRHLLSREEQLGLFAELWFLSTWLAKKVGLGVAVRRWRGPFGARHDFEWPKRSVEVKATMSTRGPIHRINGVEQLVLPDSGDLLFFSLRLREEAGASHTLPDLVLLCRQQIDVDPEGLAQLETGLVQVGYSPAHEEDYAKLRLRVVEEALFLVTGRFPRVTEATFADGVPPGVEHLEYDINLSGFTELRIAKTVDELSNI